MFIAMFNFWYFFWLMLAAGATVGLYFLLRNRSKFTQKSVLFAILVFGLLLHFLKAYIPPYSVDQARMLRDSWFVNICAANIALFPFLFFSKKDAVKDYMFYLGANYPGSWNEISEESRQSLVDQGFYPEIDLQIMPVNKLEEALQSTFGIGLADVTIPKYWGYIEAEDAYCSNHYDAYFPGVPVITSVEDNGDTVHIHYTIEGFWDIAAEDFLDTAHLILGLKRLEDGSLLAQFNVLAP